MATRLCTEVGCTAKHLAKGYCRSHYRRHGYDAGRHKPKLRQANCAWCGKLFTKVTANPQRMKSCSDECHRQLSAVGNRKSWPSSKVYPRTCLQCGSYFIGRRATAQLCSRDCALARNREQFRENYPRPELPCKGCQAETVPSHRSYCPTCVAEHKRASSNNGKHVRRVRIRNGRHERINRTKVYTRDEWTCGICHLPVDRTLTYPHPLSPSLDHVVPVARGGSHTYENVQLAHLACNLAKSDFLLPTVRQTTTA